jgi:mono/diheme cytochrome c family protein
MSNRKLTTWRLLVPAVCLAAAAWTVAAETPSKVDPSAAAVGRATFRGYCGSCHGAEAKGDGPVAEYLTIKPADLTGIAERNGGEFPFEQVVKIIDGRERVAGHGSPDMPIWGEAFAQTPGGETEEGVQKKIDQLAHFLWSVQE